MSDHIPPRGLLDLILRLTQLIAMPDWNWAKTGQWVLIMSVLLAAIVLLPPIAGAVVHGDAFVDYWIR
ncbi:hypothetical protein GV791_27990 [Nocardia cyriacigeorgica]|uniref:Uncharacterized protein n=1 Tax=Nocardia cyriacigeorgica TaxID=135487 RepID=A0A6P1CXF5_9NOCA|nr:hypothetical protein [Nocardia cyriacigeorgica]NEW36373.1 hypothetical protein [Nocardia cyriacigeorgica]